MEKRNIYLSLILLLTLLSAIFIYQISISNTIQTNISKIKSNSSNKPTRISDSKSSKAGTSTSDNSTNDSSTNDNSKIIILIQIVLHLIFHKRITQIKLKKSPLLLMTDRTQNIPLNYLMD